jgi:hypothetical protein
MLSAAFFRCKSSADCTTIMSGSNLRQRQPTAPTMPAFNIPHADLAQTQSAWFLYLRSSACRRSSQSTAASWLQTHKQRHLPSDVAQILVRGRPAT